MYPAYPLSHVSRGDRLRVRREFNIHDNAPLAVVIGRLERGKGQHVFLRAAAHVLQHLPETRFMIVGGAANHANRHFEAELKQQARDLVIADRVIFTGERHDIADILAAADVVVVPSTAPESFGLVVVESMAAGRAVIATNHGGPAEIIRHGEDGLLVRPDDDAALGRAMLRVFHNEALRLWLEHNAPARVATFSFGKMAERLTAVLQDVLACPDPIGIPAIGGRAQ
jgi:glycosyltransferase involved in cell wall biosynthesis